MDCKYYKVVRKIEDKYYSCVVVEEIGGIEYKIGEFVSPTIPNSKLCVFESLDLALGFAPYNWNIFECEIVNPTMNPFRIDPLGFDHKYVKELMEKFWAEGSRSIHSSYIETWPQGTILCDQVKLLSQVERIIK